MEKEKYFGSVRFFKNMILLFVIIAIAVPSTFAIYYGSRLHAVDAAAVSDPDALEDDAQEAADEGETAEPDYTEDAPSYQSLYPDFYAPERTMEFTRTEGVMYLTFDDGPSSVTDQILDTLKEKDVKATFFVIGHDDEESSERMRRIVSEGHTIGMHTYSHDYNTIYASVESYLSDMYDIFCQIREATGVTPTVFRFPGGSLNSYNAAISQALITEMLRRGFVPYDWNISSQDAASSKGTSAAAICDNVLSRAASVQRGIVLMHDTAAKQTTADALGEMIDGLRAQGFRFAALTPEVQPVIFGYKNDAK